MTLWRASPDPVVPGGVCTLIDVTAANIGLEVLIACLAGTAEGPNTVLTGRLGAAIGQSRHGESKTARMLNIFSRNVSSDDVTWDLCTH